MACPWTDGRDPGEVDYDDSPRTRPRRVEEVAWPRLTHDEVQPEEREEEPDGNDLSGV